MYLNIIADSVLLLHTLYRRNRGVVRASMLNALLMFAYLITSKEMALG